LTQLSKANSFLREGKFDSALKIYTKIVSNFESKSTLFLAINTSIDWCRKKIAESEGVAVDTGSKQNAIVHEKCSFDSKAVLPSHPDYPPVFIFNCVGLKRTDLHKVLARITFYFLLYRNVQAYVLHEETLPVNLDEAILEPLSSYVGPQYVQALGTRLFQKKSIPSGHKIAVAAIVSYSEMNTDHLQEIQRSALSFCKRKPQIYNIKLSNRYESSIIIDIVNNYASKYLDDNSHHPAKLFSENLSSYLKSISHYDKCHLICNGPSLGSVDPIIFEKGHAIVCNTILCNENITQHATISLECFADPIFHFGFSKYADDFRQVVTNALRHNDSYIAIPRKYFFLFTLLFADFIDRLIPVEYAKKDNFNLDLTQDNVIKATANVLTFLMVPLAATTRQEMFVYGVDGRPTENDSYFWGHDPKSQLSVQKMDDIKQAHPSFFKISFNDDYYYNHLNECNQIVTQLTTMGRSFNVVTPSFIEAFSARHYRPKFSIPAPCDRTLYIYIDVDEPIDKVTIHSIVGAFVLLTDSLNSFDIKLRLRFCFENENENENEIGKQAIGSIIEELCNLPHFAGKDNNNSLNLFRISTFCAQQSSSERKITSCLIHIGPERKELDPQLQRRVDFMGVTHININSPTITHQLLLIASEKIFTDVVKFPHSDLNLSHVLGKKRISLLDKIRQPSAVKQEYFRVINNTLALMPLSVLLDIDTDEVLMDDLVVLVTSGDFELIFQNSVRKKLLNLYNRSKPSRFAILTSFPIAALLVAANSQFGPLISTLSSFAKHLTQAYPDNVPPTPDNLQAHLRLTDAQIESISSRAIIDTVHSLFNSRSSAGYIPKTSNLPSYFNITCHAECQAEGISHSSISAGDGSGKDIWVSINPPATDLSGHYVHFDLKLAEVLSGRCPFVTLAHISFKSEIEFRPRNYRILPIFQEMALRQLGPKAYQKDLLSGLSELFLEEKYQNWNILMYIGTLGYLKATIPVLGKLAKENPEYRFTFYINLFEYADLMIYGRPGVVPFLYDRIHMDDLPDNLDILLFTDTDRSTNMFNTFFSLQGSRKVKTFPIFSPTTRKNEFKQVGSEILTIYYSCFSHNEGGLLKKGYDLALKSIVQLAQENPHIRFTIRPPYSKALDTLSQETVSLVDQAKRTDNIGLIEGVLTTEEYSNLYSQSQIVVIPYRPINFAGRTSASLLDAWMHGCIPVVLPDTWMAAQIHASPHAYGVVCSSADLHSLNASLVQLINLYQIIYKSPYINFPPYMPYKYSPENFIEVLEKSTMSTSG
jgi:glycosyltransferase involved in cell wall biosynthesis